MGLGILSELKLTFIILKWHLSGAGRVRTVEKKTQKQYLVYGITSEGMLPRYARSYSSHTECFHACKVELVELTERKRKCPQT